MLVIRRAQKKQRGRQGAAGDHHQVALEDRLLSIDDGFDASDAASRAVGVEAFDIGILQQGEIGMGSKGWVDSNDLGI